jgi:hypothetical protein
MDIAKSYSKNANLETFLAGLFLLYLVLGFYMPEPLAYAIDTLTGKIVIILCALSLFAYSNSVLAVLGVLVAYKMIITATKITGLGALELYEPTEERKWVGFPQIHKFAYTLEQEMVKKMAPLVKPDSAGKATYKPSLVDQHDAATATHTDSI